MDDTRGLLVALSLVGLLGGLALLARGLGAYRASHRVAGIGTSRVSTVAAGEVRLVGTVVPDVMTLVSPLQGVPCVYFRSRIREGSGGDATTAFSEERAVGFRLRDGSGSIRVFPRGARWDAPLRFDAASDWDGDDPPGLAVNTGPSLRPVREEPEAQVAELLAIRPPGGRLDDRSAGMSSLFSAALRSGSLGGAGSRRRDYEERRLEPGDVVTIIGSALPFGDLDDPASADRDEPGVALDDPEVARNVAEARAAGILRATPQEAWGNAAIPGFGIGRPARPPELDPEADAPELAPAEETAAAEARFEIPAGDLVLAGDVGHPLAISAGTPSEARSREDAKVLAGLAGAVLAIASAIGLALTVPALLP